MRTLTTFAITSTFVSLVSCSHNPQEAMPDPPSQESTFSLFALREGSERDAVWSPDGQWIVFGGGLGSTHDLWKIPAAGGDVVQLTSGSRNDVYPVWSPDGTRIAYSSGDWHGAFNVWTIPAAGGDPTRITTDEDSVTSLASGWGGSRVSWSPDGTLLAFSSSKRGSHDIWVIPVSGGPARQVTSDLADDLGPAWSPDGTQISFISNRSGNMALWTIPAAGGTPRQITNHPEDGLGMHNWSPDGNWLAFSSTRTGQYDIWIVPTSGGEAIPITDTPDYENGPSWSPDGSMISFHRRVLYGELWVMPSSGGEPVRLADKVACIPAGNPAWSPDGREIAFIAVGPQGKDIWKIPASGGDPEQLTHGSTVAVGFAGLSFSPDGRQIAFTSDKGGGSNIWTMPASGGTAHQVTLSGRGVWMSFSPDGREIAFNSYPGLWVVPASGGVPRRLLEWSSHFVNWSPDGEEIAFTSNHAPTEEAAAASGWHIWLVPENGGEATYLTAGSSPGWSPDGNQILFELNGDIWMIPVAGGTPSPRLETPESEGWPRFSPDGSRILFTRSTGAFESDIWIADVSGLAVLQQPRGSDDPNTTVQTLNKMR